jgi:CBS domain-containing protein
VFATAFEIELWKPAATPIDSPEGAMNMVNTTQKRCVKDVMTRDIVSLHAGSTIHEALAMMTENRVSALPIVDTRDHCVGIFTTTDLLDFTRDVDDYVYQYDVVDPVSRRWLIDKLLLSVGNEKVSSYMSEDVSTVSRETSLAIAARDMLRSQVHHLPVVDDKGRLVGIIATTDILAEFADGV